MENILKKYVYKIQNKINGKIYIGETIDIERRFKEHCRKNNNSLLGKAIKEFGKENFSLEIIEYCEDFSEKEKYYIKKFNTLFPNGYNVAEGGDKTPPIIKGENNPCSIINETIANGIIKCLLEGKPNAYIKKKFNVTKNIIRHINDGHTWKKEEYNYPLREKNRIPDFVFQVVDLLKNSKLTQKQIANKLGIARSTVTMINIGKNHKFENIEYPIKK